MENLEIYVNSYFIFSLLFSNANLPSILIYAKEIEGKKQNNDTFFNIL